jgi:hypothetical protein
MTINRYLKITSVPPGEAPLWVREKWVGLSLPIAQQKDSPSSVLTMGVLSGPKGLLSSISALLLGKFERKSGFLIETIAAISILEQNSPEAANWWRETTPHILQPRRCFLFHREVGHIEDNKTDA